MTLSPLRPSVVSSRVFLSMHDISLWGPFQWVPPAHRLDCPHSELRALTVLFISPELCTAFNFCSRNRGWWPTVLPTFCAIPDIPDLQQGQHVRQYFDCWFLNRFFNSQSKVTFVVVVVRQGLKEGARRQSYLFLLIHCNLSVAFCSSDSPNIHKRILQVGFCATLYQMYYNCHSRHITSATLLSSVNLVIPSKKQSSCLWNDLFFTNTWWLWLLVPLSHGRFQISTSPSSIIYWGFKMCTDNSNLPCFTDYFIMPLNRNIVLYFTNEEVKNKEMHELKLQWSNHDFPWNWKLGFNRANFAHPFLWGLPSPSDSVNL